MAHAPPTRPLSRPLTRRSVLVLALAAALFSAGATAQDGPQAPTRAQVASVYDGDTFTLTSGEKVRVSGINTPEIKPLEPYAVEARDATAELVMGKVVTLEYGAVQRDSYGRLLGWVRIDGRPLELELLERGLAHVMVIPPLEVGDLDAMLAAQSGARAARRGLWSQEGFQSTMHITSFHANAPGDDRANVNGEYLRVCNISDGPVNLDGYRMVDAAGNSWALPAVVVPAGHTVKVHSGQGEHQSDPSRQLEIYLGSPSPIWNNDADRAALYDRYGHIVDVREHKVQNATK